MKRSPQDDRESHLRYERATALSVSLTLFVMILAASRGVAGGQTKPPAGKPVAGQPGGHCAPKGTPKPAPTGTPGGPCGKPAPGKTPPSTPVPAKTPTPVPTVTPVPQPTADPSLVNGYYQ